jgi:hypothetical protein
MKKKYRGPKRGSVEYGVSNTSNTQKNRSGMMTSGERTLDLNVSASNLFAQLYTLGLVKDNEEVLEITIRPGKKGEKLQNKKWKEGTIIPIQIKVKEVEKLNS